MYVSWRRILDERPDCLEGEDECDCVALQVRTIVFSLIWDVWCLQLLIYKCKILSFNCTEVAFYLFGLSNDKRITASPSKFNQLVESESVVSWLTASRFAGAFSVNKQICQANCSPFQGMGRILDLSNLISYVGKGIHVFISYIACKFLLCTTI